MSEVIRAPELTGETLDWYNVHAPLTLEQLRGRLVILDFWTFCCVNCMNAVPSLQQLQTLFPEELVVIGVHSPKFAAEMDPQRLIAAMERLDITHPVIHDPLLKLWEAYCIKAWPSLVIISPQGRIVDVLQGEPDGDMLMVDIAQLLAKYHQQGLIKKSTLNCCDPRSTSGRYRFPSGLKPVRLEDGQPAWALCDSGHHQVVLLDDSGKEIRRLGSGTRGFLDGDLNEARFDSPQGLIFAENDIYVADTANHAIRHISLSQNRIETIAGIGLRGDPLLEPEDSATCLLASVWDLEYHAGQLYFANAGTHQLGRLDLSEGMVYPLAGTGQEHIIDGPALDARLAQPSGLCLSPCKQYLYFADAETSAIRRVLLDQDGSGVRVETLVGCGLFDFGHRNGEFLEVLMQHPLGLTCVQDQVFVADSYNGALRKLDLKTNWVSDVHFRDIAEVAEPVSIACRPDMSLLLVDSHNHRVLELCPGRPNARTWTQ